MTGSRRTLPDDRDPDADDGRSDIDDVADVAGHVDVGATVACPYCGAPNEIALDPSGGRRQDYVEDCQVCCQPWNVRVQYHRDGTADVQVDAADAD